MKKLMTLLLALTLVVMAFAGCTTDTDSDPNPDTTNDGGETPTGDDTTNTDNEDKGTISLAYVNWAEGVALTNLAAAILEDKLGYEVEMTMADAGPVFTSVANGDSDAFLDAWLPITHETYMNEYSDDLVDLGYNYEGARIGLVVPSYVEIDSIEEMNDVADQFNGEIVGIDAGAGIMSTTNTALEDYGLNNFELLTSSGPIMTAALSEAIENEEWVVVTGWAPHWKFATWDLKFLEDPKGIFGEVENIHTVVRKDLPEEMPEVANFFTNFLVTDAQLGDLMGAISEGEAGDELEIARQWMNENEELVNSWVE